MKVEMTKEMWQIVTDEMRDCLLEPKLKAIYEKVYKDGFAKGCMANRDAVAVADCVSTWMADNNLKKEISALTLLWDKLEGEDRKIVFKAMDLFASINTTIDYLNESTNNFRGGESALADSDEDGGGQ